MTETDLKHPLKEDFPNGNLILREDYQKSFKKRVRWNDTKSLMIGWEDYCEVYPSYSNGEKDRCVCRSSRENGMHNGLDKRKQAVKMVECTGLRRSEPFSRGSVNTETLHQNRVTQSVRIF